MKLKNYTYSVLKYVNRRAGFTFYVLESEQARCRITMMDEGTEKMSVGLTSYELKKYLMKGWVLDGHYPYEYKGLFARERSKQIIEAITEADKVVDDLIQFRMMLKNRCEIQVDEYRFPPEEKNKTGIKNES